MFNRSINKKLDIIIQLLTEIRNNQPKFLPDVLYVNWNISNGSLFNMSSGAVSLNLTQKAVGTVSELNNDGSVFTFDPTKIQAAVQDTTVLTASVDTTTGNVTVTPLKAGSTSVVVQDSATGVSSPTYTFTVTQTVSPASLSVSWTVA